jgi:head-tail adaptor
MAKIHAGDLHHRFIFGEMGNAEDGAGGTTTAFEDRFTTYAGVVHMRGGESVMAGRLAGRHTQIVQVRVSSNTRRITTDWRAKNARTGEEFAIRDITPTDDRAFLEILCESGVAS